MYLIELSEQNENGEIVKTGSQEHYLSVLVADLKDKSVVNEQMLQHIIYEFNKKYRSGSRESRETINTLINISKDL